jgi:hypothetical protein
VHIGTGLVSAARAHKRHTAGTGTCNTFSFIGEWKGTLSEKCWIYTYVLQIAPILAGSYPKQLAKSPGHVSMAGKTTVSCNVDK